MLNEWKDYQPSTESSQRSIRAEFALWASLVVFVVLAAGLYFVSGWLQYSLANVSYLGG